MRVRLHARIKDAQACTWVCVRVCVCVCVCVCEVCARAIAAVVRAGVLPPPHTRQWLACLSRIPSIISYHICVCVFGGTQLIDMDSVIWQGPPFGGGWVEGVGPENELLHDRCRMLTEYA